PSATAHRGRDAGRREGHFILLVGRGANPRLALPRLRRRTRIEGNDERGTMNDELKAKCLCSSSLIVSRSSFQLLSGLPQRLQKRAEASFCCAPHAGHLRLTRRFAPQPEQKSDPEVTTAPHVPQRPGIGGT